MKYGKAAEPENMQRHKMPQQNYISYNIKNTQWLKHKWHALTQLFYHLLQTLKFSIITILFTSRAAKHGTSQFTGSNEGFIVLAKGHFDTYGCEEQELTLRSESSQLCSMATLENNIK